MDNYIEEFLLNKNYDIRISHNGRWIDQKCTPDVLNFVSDCVLNFVSNNVEIEFTKNDIWHSNYADEWVKQIFTKPHTNEPKSSNEYDKFFSQPLKLLSYMGVLTETQKGKQNFYKVNNLEILDSIARSNKIAFIILEAYIEKVLRDSGLWDKVRTFVEKQNEESFRELKASFADFTKLNTKINKDLECNRIFSKVINPIAVKYGILGTRGGILSKNPITFADLMYNRENFRDISKEKPKNVSRKEWEAIHPRKINKSYYVYESTKAKRILRKFNNKYRLKKSEVNDEWGKGEATQMHHIFPQHEFLEISMYLENIIALTPTQHYTKAHPQNNTKLIDKSYQEVLLHAKALQIEENISNEDVPTIYDFNKFVYVLNIGFDKDYKVEEGDYATIMQIIDSNIN